MKKISIPSMLVGILIGAIFFGGSVAVAAGIIANPTTSKVIVNGKEVKVAAYNISDANYFKLRDFAAAVNVGVWYDAKNKTINVDTNIKYDPNYAGPSAATSAPNNSFSDYVPYSTGSLEELLYNLSKGNVVYRNGQYWATPEYATMLANENVVYFKDISGNTDTTDRYGLSDESVNQAIAEMKNWISEDGLSDKSVTFMCGDTARILNKSTGFYSYGSLSGTVGNLLFAVPDYDDTINSDETKVFNGVTINKRNGILYFRVDELKKLNIID